MGLWPQPGARGPGPAESGLITYSVLQVLGLAFATATPLAAAAAVAGGPGRPHSGPTGISFSSLPHLEAAEAAAGLSRDTGRRTLRLRLLPAGPAPDSMRFESHFKSYFGNVKAFNLKKIKIIAEPVAAMAGGGLRQGGDGRRIP